MRALVISLFLLPSLLMAVPLGIELSWSQAECRPGDVVELLASRIFDELTTYELRLPQHEALHLVAHQRQPVHYKGGVYRQNAVWILQPLNAGLIELENIRVILKQGDFETERFRGVPPLRVNAYSLSEDTDAPEPLPEPEVSQVAGRSAWFWLVLAIPPVIWLLVRYRKRPAPESKCVRSISLEGICSVLVEGGLPIHDIEHVLTNERQSLTPEQRTALERAIYSPSTDPAALYAELVEERGS